MSRGPVALRTVILSRDEVRAALLPSSSFSFSSSLSSSLSSVAAATRHADPSSRFVISQGRGTPWDNLLRLYDILETVSVNERIRSLKG